MHFNDDKNWQPAWISNGDVTQDGHGLWWYGPEARERRLDESSMQLTNLPCVYHCICGDHPLPSQPVMSSYVSAFDGIGGTTANRFLLSGIPRSGSTAVWQVMTLLSGGTTNKSHEFGDVCPLFYMYEKVFCCVRHPFDAYFSALRAFEKTSMMEKPMKELYKFRRLQVFQESTGYRPDLHVHFIKYEDFWDKELERIEHLASLMEIDCSVENAQSILAFSNVNRNKERSLLPEVETPDANAGIHKGHIGALKGKPGQGAGLPSQVKKNLVKNHSWIFEYFNYSTEL